MKKKILTIIFFIIISFVLVISTSAVCMHKNRETTSFEYQNGYNLTGIESFVCKNCNQTTIQATPLITFLGYSASGLHNGICAGFEINQRALSYYMSTNKSFELGVVAASRDVLEGNLPLDSSTAKPIELEQGSVAKIALPNDNFLSIDMQISGFTSEFYSKQLILSAYVYDGNKVVYIQNEQKETALDSKSFLSIVDKESATVGDMEYSLVEETEQSADRLKQMASSNATYNTGSSKSSSELDSIERSAKLIIAGGDLLGYKKATGFLAHYLNNTGEQFNLSMATFLKDSVALKNRNDHINQMLRAAEALAIEYASVNVHQAQERVNHNLTGDWKYSLGSYFDDVDILNLTVTEIGGERVYRATLKYTVVDFYNWNEAVTSGFLNGKGPSQYELAQLHKAGRAKEFLTYGEITYDISWTEGKTAEQIVGLN